MYKIKIRYGNYIVHWNEKVIEIFKNEKHAVSLVDRLNQQIKDREMQKVMEKEKRYQDFGRNKK